MNFGILKFQEVYLERIWGGTKLERVLGRQVPKDVSIGEAWLIADHPSCESVVAEGPWHGKTLHDLMVIDQAGILGEFAKPTATGRFPLLLKLIDAGDVLSVQVHPDDTQARTLNEPDGGKTEMWYILDADRDSMLLSGLQEGTTPEILETALRAGTADRVMQVFSVTQGDAVFVAAGNVHAIGAGILLAEIQQNSDITYRLYDWNRVDKNGKSRELHIEKGMKVINFDDSQRGLCKPKVMPENGYSREVLASCPFFTAEKLCVEGTVSFNTENKSFHILQASDDNVFLGADTMCSSLRKGEAALIPASTGTWTIKSESPVLHYYIAERQV